MFFSLALLWSWRWGLTATWMPAQALVASAGNVQLRPSPNPGNKRGDDIVEVSASPRNHVKIDTPSYYAISDNSLLPVHMGRVETLKQFPVLARPPSGHLGVVIVIYVGRMLPSYFHAFALSVERSGSQLKWLVFVTDAHSYGDYYENIEVVRISRRELFGRIARVDSRLSRHYIRGLLEKTAYSLVELKPCLATMFEVTYIYMITAHAVDDSLI
jgi:hypothetical protein